MAQIKIYGLKESLQPIQRELSDAIHSCVVEALDYPAQKRFHRFIGMAADEFIFPESKTARYTIVEISMFAGRTDETKRKLIRMLFDRLGQRLGLGPDDLEITITENPKVNWGIRGAPADELDLGYKVEL